LTGANFTPTSEVRHFGMLEATGLKIKDVEVIFSDMSSLMNFIKMYQLVQNMIEVQTHTDRKVIALAYIFTL
jgi:hypothetical protein